jgi:hypothetical protein
MKLLDILLETMLNESNSISIPEFNKRKKEIEKEKSYIKAFNELEKKIQQQPKQILNII